MFRAQKAGFSASSPLRHLEMMTFCVPPTLAIAQRITDGIDSRLIAKGLRKVEADANPDLIVLYHAAVGTNVKINTNNPGGYNWGRWWDGRPDEPTAGNPDFDVVELTVDIGDARSEKLL
jgi:hypothetical protein